MQEEAIDLLKSINDKLKVLEEERKGPKLIYSKEIAENYNVNRNKATEFCKKYGTNFGGYCIEVEKFKEVLQTKGQEIFK